MDVVTKQALKRKKHLLLPLFLVNISHCKTPSLEKTRDWFSPAVLSNCAWGSWSYELLSAFTGKYL